MSTEIYLDNNATTRVAPECLDAMLACLRDEFGNPSSKHRAGERARQLVNEARAQVAELLNALPAEIVFTGSGTESNHSAILGALALDPAKTHVVTSVVEHAATLLLLKHLEAHGVHVTYLPVNAQGQIDLAALESAITANTALVTVQWANNETGVIFPIESITRLVKAKNVLLHVDAVQAAGKLAIDMRSLPPDLLSISGHKLHAPKGVGGLFVRKGLKLPPLLFGHQERNRRGGTENVPAIVGYGIASTLVAETWDSDLARMAMLRDKLEGGVLSSISFATVNGAGSLRIANTTNIRFGELTAEAIADRLSRAGVYVSLGAACSAGNSEPSHVLSAMGNDRRAALASIRFSLSRYTTAVEIDRLLALLPAIIHHPAVAA